MKICTKCKEPYPATMEYFYVAKSNKDGLQAKCKKCCRKAIKRCDQKYHNTINGYLHRVYDYMNQRCNNPKRCSYKNYGERGIRCLISFNDFRDWIKFDKGITDISQLQGLQIDRKDNNGNYEKGNLRLATRAENIRNSRKRKTWHGRPTSSKFKGICWDQQEGKWIAQIAVNGKHIHLGRFGDEIEAAHAYDTAAIKYHKEFARTNAMEGLYDSESCLSLV